MRYSIEPKNKIYVKKYVFLSFAKNVSKNLSNIHDQELLEKSQEIYNRCNKNCYKKSNSKKAEANGDLMGNKITVK